MHENGFLHRNLKLENILYDNKEKNWVIIDLGCAKRLAKS